MAALTKEEDLQDQLITFSVLMTVLADSLPETRAGNHLAERLLRLGTAPAPNYAEALGAESQADFVRQLKCVFVQLRATQVWLRVLRGRPGRPDRPGLREGSQTCEELMQALRKLIGRAKRRNQGTQPPVTPRDNAQSPGGTGRESP